MEEKKERQEREDKEASPKKEIKAKVGVVSKIKALATGYVELSEKELEPALDELELSLLEADVAYDVVEEIIANLKRDLVGKPLAKDRVQEAVRESIRKTLLSYLEDGKDVVELVRSSNKRPYVILFFGINGAGKTTTIAKIAHLLQGAGFSVVMAAADTFRAAAIEQLEEHANKLSLKAIKSSYGSHPASVVHNAIEHAKNKGVDVVLVDTAGRQDVNLSLMKELEKVVRVAKPDLRLFVGESTSGNALYEQVKTYKELVGIDGVILTKLDLDPKGGTAISVGKATGVPIYYITTGQGYEDIERFSRDWLIKRLF
ncbi:MAG: signal recognition particle-docking protein FtsY [Methanobacteriota archaeon]|nr:MAG: signal recognition particle-docking protein FtsY [Euryarchaeota archaeon]